MDGGSLIISCSVKTKALAAQKGRVPPREKHLYWVVFISALFIPMGYGITLDFLQLLFYFANIVMHCNPFFPLMIPHFCTATSHVTEVLNSTLPKFKYSQMCITYQSSHQATQSYGIIFNICTGKSKLSGMTNDWLVLPISWQRGKERNCQKCKNMLSMNETQKGINSDI